MERSTLKVIEFFFREGKERLCHELEKLQKKKEEVDAKIHAFGEVFTELEVRNKYIY